MLAAYALAITLLKTADITFVRHAETIANATGKYNSQTLDTFSDKGQKQVADLTKWLISQPKFDFILVSPSKRALMTIDPYLKATHQRATVWPLLYECCTQKRPKGAHPTSFTFEGHFALMRRLADEFKIVPGKDQMPYAKDYNAGLAQVQSEVLEFGEMHLTGRVLIIGHAANGGQFIHAISKRWRELKNASPVQFTN